MSVRGMAVMAAAALALVAAAVAQQQRTYTIAVAVASRDARIQQLAPELRKQAADVVGRSAPNVRTIIVTGSKAEAAEQARKNAADYLLRIDLSPRPTAEVQIAGPRIGATAPTTGQDPNIYGSPGANMQGEMFLAWSVEPLKGKNPRLHDDRTVHPAEYPVDPQFDWLRAIASRSVRDAAAAAVEQLKKKKGL